MGLIKPWLTSLRQGLRAIDALLLGPDNQYGWLPYLWLSYLLLYFIPLAQAELSLWLALWAWFAGLATVGLYFLALPKPSAKVVAWLLAVGFGAAMFYQGGVILLSYAACFMGFVTPKAKAWGLMALYAVAALVISLWLPLTPILLLVLWFALLWGMGNSIHQRNEERSRVLQLTQQEAQAIARLQERERIRADLHDLLGQSLTTIALNMQVLARVELEPEHQRRLVVQTQQLAREALAQARATLSNNYQATLEEVIASCRVACLAKGVQFKISSLPKTLSQQQNHALAQALRESVTNSLRHSQASQIWAQFNQSQHQLLLTISDDGGGQPHELGTGLNSLKARIEQLNGQVQFQPGWQTQIRLPQ